MSLFVCPHCKNTFSTGSVFKNFLFSRPLLEKKVKCAHCKCILKPKDNSEYGLYRLFSSSVFEEIFWYLIFITGGIVTWQVLGFFDISAWWLFFYAVLVIIGAGYQILEGRKYTVLKK